jgi:hypothetical protein
MSVDTETIASTQAPCSTATAAGAVRPNVADIHTQKTDSRTAHSQRHTQRNGGETEAPDTAAHSHTQVHTMTHEHVYNTQAHTQSTRLVDALRGLSHAVTGAQRPSYLEQRRQHTGVVDVRRRHRERRVQYEVSLARVRLHSAPARDVAAAATGMMARGCGGRRRRRHTHLELHTPGCTVGPLHSL